MLKKAWMVFAVAFGYPLAYLLLSYLVYLMESGTLPPLILGSVPLDGPASSLFFLLLDTVGVFTLFFYFGRTANVKVTKTTVLAVFLGFVVGYILYMVILFVGTGASGTVSTSLRTNAFMNAVGAVPLLTRNLQLFFPAFAALLFVEWRSKSPAKSQLISTRST
jgi:hypothetical protein